MINTLNREWRGGERGIWDRFDSSLLARIQADWMLDWRSPASAFRDDRSLILIQESVNWFGSAPHESAISCKNTKVFTYLADLDGFENFHVLYHPYSFSKAGYIEHSSPLTRPKMAYYCFAQDKITNAFDGTLDVFARAKVTGNNHNKPIIASLSRVVSSQCGPMFKDKIENMSEFRFGIACENMITNGYVSEKLFDCILADTIPIYMGHALPSCLADCAIHVNSVDHAVFDNILSMSDEEYMSRLTKIRIVKENICDMLREFSYEFFERELKNSL
jgi:hypothetical protein